MVDDERLPWFPCFPTKLLGALAAMPPAQGYIYWIVCLRIYETNGPISDTLDALVRRTGYNRRVVSDSLDVLFRTGKLIRESGLIMNPFAERVMTERKANHEKRKSAGAKGGKRSAQKHKVNQADTPSNALATGEPGSTHLDLDKDKKEKIPAPRGAALGGDLFEPDNKKKKVDPTPEERDLFRRGKEVLGEKAGGMIVNLLNAKGRNVSLARSAIETASTTHEPREYIGRIIQGPRSQATGGNAFARRILERMGGDDGD